MAPRCSLHSWKNTSWWVNEKQKHGFLINTLVSDISDQTLDMTKGCHDQWYKFYRSPFLQIQFKLVPWPPLRPPFYRIVDNFTVEPVEDFTRKTSWQVILLDGFRKIPNQNTTWVFAKKKSRTKKLRVYQVDQLPSPQTGASVGIFESSTVWFHWDTVDGLEIRRSQVEVASYPFVSRAFYIPGGVCQDIWTINSISPASKALASLFFCPFILSRRENTSQLKLKYLTFKQSLLKKQVGGCWSTT